MVANTVPVRAVAMVMYGDDCCFEGSVEECEVKGSSAGYWMI